MRKKSLFFCLLISSLICCSCSSAPEYHSQAFFAMDTFSELRIYSDMENAEEVLIQGKSLIEDIETAISVTKESGDVYRLNEEVSLSAPSPYLTELIEISKEISKITDGCFDIRTGAQISLWEQCASEGRLPTEAELAAATALVSSVVTKQSNILIKSNRDLQLHFGAIGKGYATDCVAEQLRASGVTCGMISFVSSVTVFGERASGKAFRVAIRTPDTTGNILGYVSLEDCSLSVSGNYERYYEIGEEKYYHILDPKTGAPVDNGILSVIVIAESAAYADALSTAITVMGPERALSLYRVGEVAFEAAILMEDELLMTDGFSDIFSRVDETYKPILLSERFS